MSDENGAAVLKVGRKGMLKCQLGDDGPLFEVDVIRLMSSLAEVEREFRDAEGKVLPGKLEARNEAVLQFVQKVLASGGEGRAAQINMTEALEFIKGWTEKGAELRAFFAPSTGKEQSSPARTELRFSA